MCGDLTSHTYNVEVIEEIVKDILQQFHPAFMEFEQSFKNRKIQERPGLMSHGLSPNTMATIHGILLRLPAVESATLHGSRAKGNHRPGSDIDLTLHGKNLTPAILADIEDALDDQLLPYTFDLSIFAMLDHPPLKEHIRRVGCTFYP